MLHNDFCVMKAADVFDVSCMFQAFAMATPAFRPCLLILLQQSDSRLSLLYKVNATAVHVNRNETGRVAARLAHRRSVIMCSREEMAIVNSEMPAPFQLTVKPDRHCSRRNRNVSVKIPREFRRKPKGFRNVRISVFCFDKGAA